MFQLEALIDTSVLPSNIMTLRDDKFIDFVKAEAGEGAAALLEVQGINCVKSLLMTPDVYAIMNIKSKSLDCFKNNYGYMQDDGTFILQPGTKGNVEYLIDLLKKKCIEDAKLAKSSKYNQSSSSTIAKSTVEIVTSNSSPEEIPLKSSNLSVGEHRTYIIDTLNSWCEKNKAKFNLSQLSLIEGPHYFISIFNDSCVALKCDIRCCCEKWSSLTLRRGKFQLSNFYRHIQNSDNLCPAIEKIINNPQLSISSSANTQQSSTASDNASQQVASPSLMQIIQLPDATRSSLTLSTASSNSNGTNNNESTIKKSSISKSKRQGKRKVQNMESSYGTKESAKRTRRR